MRVRSYLIVIITSLHVRESSPQNGNRHFDYKLFENQRNSEAVFSVMPNVKYAVSCFALCLTQDTCLSVNFNGSDCELSSALPTAGNTHTKAGWTMGAKSTSLITTCWMGDEIIAPTYYASSCADLYKRLRVRKNGVYGLQLSLSPPKIIQVYCDMTSNGGGWTVIQKRRDGSVDFYRNWVDYACGFGNLTTEFWLGNDVIHTLVSESQAWMIRFDLEDADGNWRYAEYDTFNIASEANKYRLAAGSYSGNAGDGLVGHRNHMFSTKDSDNDNYQNSCAKLYEGAWWYNSCHRSNLNGNYTTPGTVTTFADNMVWHSWHGHYYCLKTSIMKVRPANFIV